MTRPTLVAATVAVAVAVVIGRFRGVRIKGRETAVLIVRRSVLAAGLAAGLAVMTGCAGSAADAPAGWTVVTDRHITVQRPSGWEPQPSSSETWTHRFVGDGMEMQVSGLFSDDDAAVFALAKLDLPAMVELDGYVDGGYDFFTVDGADSALRSDFTYTDGGTTKKGVWLIAGQYPASATAAIAITGERLDEAVIEHVVETMTFNRSTS